MTIRVLDHEHQWYKDERGGIPRKIDGIGVAIERHIRAAGEFAGVGGRRGDETDAWGNRVQAELRAKGLAEE